MPSYTAGLGCGLTAGVDTYERRRPSRAPTCARALFRSGARTVRPGVYRCSLAEFRLSLLLVPVPCGRSSRVAYLPRTTSEISRAEHLPSPVPAQSAQGAGGSLQTWPTDKLLYLF